MATYVFAETQLTQMQSVSVWMASWLYSLITPLDQAPEAMKTVLHSLATFEIDQQWEAQQLRIDARREATPTTSTERTSRLNMRALPSDRAVSKPSGRIHARLPGSRSGRVDSVDGTQREVWAGSGGTHWMTPQGDIVNSPTNPGGGAHVLQTVP